MGAQFNLMLVGVGGTGWEGCGFVIEEVKAPMVPYLPGLEFGRGEEVRRGEVKGKGFLRVWCPFLGGVVDVFLGTTGGLDEAEIAPADAALPGVGWGADDEAEGEDEGGELEEEGGEGEGEQGVMCEAFGGGGAGGWVAHGRSGEGVWVL